METLGIYEQSKIINTKCFNKKITFEDIVNIGNDDAKHKPKKFIAL